MLVYLDTKIWIYAWENNPSLEVRARIKANDGYPLHPAAAFPR
jgi:hypothetical protein